AIAVGRVLRRYFGIGKIGRVSPGAADPHVRRTERLGHSAESPVCEIDWWATLMEVAAHPGGRVPAAAFNARRSGGLRRRLPNFLVRLPEFPAGHLQHLNIVRLIALVDRADTPHGRRGEEDG